MLTFGSLKSEVKRRATRDQSGTTFDSGIEIAINTSLFRVARECPWRVLRRKTYFNTETSYSTGTGAAAVTVDDPSFSVTGATFRTSGVKIGRRIKFGTDSSYYTIREIQNETTGILDRNYAGTTSTTTSYEILPTEEYNLPIQVNPQRDFMWHNAYGSPTQLQYITDQDFRGYSVSDVSIGTPLCYRMWGSDMTIKQISKPAVIRVYSSSNSDTTQSITIFGIVSGYPDYEIIACNGTTAVLGTKTFSSVERIVKNSTSTGRFTIDADSATDVLGVIPVGGMTLGIYYPKVQLWPLPDDVYPINVQYYKDPWSLVNDGDIHEMGQDFDEAIILLAVAKIKYETSMNDDGDRFAALYVDEIKSLRRVQMDKIDFFASLRKPSDSRGARNGGITRGLSYLQLGPNYGPGGYR